MIKIIFVITSLNGGGAERVFTHIINNIDKDKFQIILAVGKKEGYFLNYIPGNIEIVELAGSTKSSKSFMKLLYLLKKEKPDIVFSTLGMVSTSTLCSFFISNKTRFISRLGNTISSDLNRVKKESFKKYLAQKIYYAIVIKKTEIITQSQFMKNDLIKLYPFAKYNDIYTVYNPVESPNEIKRIISNKNTIQLITVGRLAWQKGYDYLIKAMAIVSRIHPNIKLTIIGTGELKEELEYLAHELGVTHKIEFAGYQNKPFEYVKNPDIFISSSRFEGFSNVIIESIANGIPVVATDCPSGNREIIVNNKNGWLSSMEGDVINNLAKTIDIALNNYSKLNMSQEQTNILNKLDMSKIIREYEHIFSNKTQL